MNKLFLLLVMLILLDNTFAQSDFQNHQKYWYLRTKLKNDFMKIGIGPGNSVPFAQRGKGSSGTNASNIIYQSSMLIGDAISELGLYIGVLATEFKILNDNQQNTDSIKYELYCALNAVNRLDYDAEPWFGNFQPSLNGFLMRDDFDKLFIRDNYKHFNYYNSWDGVSTHNVTQSNFPSYNTLPAPYLNQNNINQDRGFCSKIPQGQYEVNSDYQRNWYVAQYPGGQCDGGPCVGGHKSMSKDHIISLLYGLRMVSKFVPTSANFNNNQAYLYTEPGTTFVQVAKNISDRILTRLKNDSWQIKDPSGNDISEADGGHAKANAYALAEIGGLIDSPTMPSTGSPPTNNSTFHDNFTQSSGFAEFQLTVPTFGTKMDEIAQLAELSAACNCLYATGEQNTTTTSYTWTKVLKWFLGILNWIYELIKTVVTYITSIYVNQTTIGILTNATFTGLTVLPPQTNIYYPQDHALLAHKLLNSPNQSLLPGAYSTATTRVINALNDCPCSGPSNFTNGNYENFTWSGYSLIEHTNTLDNNLFSGEYNGIDYMLLHNLYYLNSTVSNQIGDLSNRFITYGLPIGNTSIGSNSNPLTLGAFENVVANNILTSNASSTYRAGKKVILNPGFKATTGSVFKAYVDAYDCGSPKYTNELMRAASSNTKSSNYDEMGGQLLLDNVPSIPNNSTMASNNSQALPKVQGSMNNTAKKIVDLNSTIELFPNPAHDEVFIKINSSDNTDMYDIEFINSVGQLTNIFMAYSTENNTIKIKHEGFTPGLYIVNVTSKKTGKKYENKIVIQ